MITASGVRTENCKLTWQVVKPSFTQDIGTQRCRLPHSLFTLLNDVTVGSYILISLGSQSCVCCAYVWQHQPANYCQVDESVTLLNETVAMTAPAVISVSSFKKLRVQTMKHITVTLIMDSYSDVRRCSRSKKAFTPLLRDVLSTYFVTRKAKIDCSSFTPCKLLKICFILVEDCCLQSPLLVGRVTSKTMVEIANVISKARYEACNNDRRDIVLGGLEKPRQLLRDLLMYPFQHGEILQHLGVTCPKGILLIGPPGTGKTSLVHSVVQDCGASLVYLAGPTVCKSNSGESESSLRDIFSRARELCKEGPCVLFIDEIDSLLSKRGHEKGSHQSARLSSQALTLIDDLRQAEHLILIGATNRPNILNLAVRRPGRFDHEVYIGMPTKVEREHILKAITSKLPLCNVNLKNIADCTPGFVGADLVSLCQHIALSKINTKNQTPITEMDFHDALMVIRPSTQRSSFAVTDLQPISWNNIGGLENVKLQIRQFIEWPIKHSEKFQRLGIPKPKGVLLYGPPGCCKTTLVRAAATSCNVSFLSASAAQIYAPYVGDSEKAIAELFHLARLGAPTILFLDEIDAIVGKRNLGSHRGTHETVLSTLLNEMDGIGLTPDSKQGSCHDQLDKESYVNNKVNLRDSAEVLLVAATNRVDLLDQALLRPGRFDRIIYVPPPDDNARLKILQILTAKIPVSDVDFYDIAKRTLNFTGADLENFCKEVALCALTLDGLDAHFIHQQHFLTVLERTKPSLSERQIHFYAKQLEKLCRI